MSSNVQKYPIGIQTFSELRENNYIYVDKTQYIVDFISKGLKYVFLSRPRRFGKSLFLSTVESYFKGQRNLFNGLCIDHAIPEEWEVYPVIHLDLSGADYNKPEVLEDKLDSFVDALIKEYDLDITDGFTARRFIDSVKQIHGKTGKQVVILIDEYDSPITSAIDDVEVQSRLREILYGFYSSIKNLDGSIKFCMLTGITKYGHLSVFSGLNNLKDISMLNDYAGICGITESELHENFQNGVTQLAAEEDISVDAAYKSLKDFYDGYHFSRSMLDVYNPFSLLNALADRQISDYWFKSGIPTLLLKTLKAGVVDISKIGEEYASESVLNNISADNVDPYALLYQTGYLTIKEYNRLSRLYRLDYPNREIKVGLMNSVLAVYADTTNPEAFVYKLRSCLSNGKVQDFVNELTAFFAGVPYDLRRNVAKFENYYHSLFYVIIKLLGLDIDAEYHTSEGSIDILIKTAKFIYIIELKMNCNADAAMSQIEERQYALQFVNDGRKLIKVGLGFNESAHTITSSLIS